MTQESKQPSQRPVFPVYRDGQWQAYTKPDYSMENSDTPNEDDWTAHWVEKEALRRRLDEQNEQ
jgi:hypothetical protein